LNRLKRWRIVSIKSEVMDLQTVGDPAPVGGRLDDNVTTQDESHRPIAALLCVAKSGTVSPSAATVGQMLFRLTGIHPVRQPRAITPRMEQGISGDSALRHRKQPLEFTT